MNNTIIEQNAVDFLSLFLRKTGLIQPNISKNDKTISWDGEIFLFKNKNHTKNALIGKIPVQVKGTRRKLEGITVKHSVEISDLNNYYNDNGCMFFYVYYDEKNDNGSIYYRKLLPVDLKVLLEKYGKQKICSIEFDLLSNKTIGEVFSIMNDFIYHRKMQSGSIIKKYTSLEELQKSGVKIKDIKIEESIFGDSIADVKERILKNVHYPYAEVEGESKPLPITPIEFSGILEKRICDISVNGKNFYNSVGKITTRNGDYYRIGQSTKLSFDEKKRLKISFKLDGTLELRIHDLKFLLSILDNKQFEINGKTIPLPQVEEIDKEKEKKRLQYFLNIKKTLKQLGIREQLDLNGLSKSDEEELKMLILSVMNGNGKKIVDNDIDELLPIQVGNLRILARLEKNDNGKYYITSFFKRKKMFANIELGNGKIEKREYSQFILLNEKLMREASNMDYETISKDIISKPHWQEYDDAVQRLMLMMLKVYDVKKDELILECAEEIQNWIMEVQDNTDMNLLNNMQIIKRKRNLTTDEQSQLGELIGTNKPLVIRCGGFLLLDKNKEAQDCFKKMSEEEKEIFIDYPISAFGELRIKDDHHIK